MSRKFLPEEWKSIPVGTRVKILRFCHPDSFFYNRKEEASRLLGIVGVRAKEETIEGARIKFPGIDSSFPYTNSLGTHIISAEVEFVDDPDDNY